MSMTNAERIALTHKQESGYDSYNEDYYVLPKTSVAVTVRGKVFVYKPGKEVKQA